MMMNIEMYRKVEAAVVVVVGERDTEESSYVHTFMHSISFVY